MKKLLFIYLALTSFNFKSQNLTKNNIGGFTNKTEAKNSIDSSGLKQGKWIEYLDTRKGWYSKDLTIYSLSKDCLAEFVELPNDSAAAFYRLVIYKDGKYSEKERIYDLSGNLKREIDFVDGRGIYKTVYTDTLYTGKSLEIKIEIPFLNGEIDGIYKSNTYKKYRQEIPFKKGKIDGVWQVFYKRKLIYELTYLQGEPIGVGKSYHLNGLLSKETPYENGKINGIEKEYIWGSGKLWIETPYVDGKVNGIQKYYWTYPDKISRLTPYLDGKKHGVEKQYNSNGRLKAERTYVYDKKDGIERTFSEEGRLLTVTSYKDGVANETENYNENTQGNELLQGILLGTQILQTGIAVQQYKNNPNSQTINNLANVTTNNLTKNTEEAVKSNNNTLTSMPIVESSASTNGGNTTSSVSGNSAAAAKCAKDTKREWEENSTAHKTYLKNKSCNKLAYKAQKELAEMLLNSCRQYLPQNEIDGFNKTITSLEAQINSMEDCKNLIEIK